MRLGKSIATAIAVHAAIADAHHTKLLSVTGAYTGNSSANRAIPHGLGAVAKVVLILEISTFFYWYQINSEAASISYMSPADMNLYAVTAIDATNFYVGNATSYSKSANDSGKSYIWVAFG